MIQVLNHLYLADLNGLWHSVQSGWIKPLYLAGIAVFALKFLKDRQFTQLLIFAAIAALVGVFIFAGDSLFGSSNSGLTGVANKQAQQINTIALQGTYYKGLFMGMLGR